MKLHMDWSLKRSLSPRTAAPSRELRQRVGGVLAESLGVLGERLGRGRSARSDQVGMSRLREVLDRDRALVAANPEEPRADSASTAVREAPASTTQPFAFGASEGVDDAAFESKTVVMESPLTRQLTAAMQSSPPMQSSPALQSPPPNAGALDPSVARVIDEMLGAAPWDEEDEDALASSPIAAIVLEEQDDDAIGSSPIAAIDLEEQEDDAIASSPMAAIVLEEQPVAPSAPPVCREPIRTRTMARLLASQGHPDRALSIYEFLLARSPGDAELCAEADALRGARA